MFLYNLIFHFLNLVIKFDYFFRKMAQAQVDNNNILLAIPGVEEIVDRARQEGFQAGVDAARNEIWQQGLNNDVGRLLERER